MGFAIRFLSQWRGFLADSDEDRPQGLPDSRSDWPLLWGGLGIWLLVHFLYRSTVIYHDSWKFNFPIVFRIMQQGEWWVLPQWLTGVDDGSPVLLYSMSCSLFNPIKLLMLTIGSRLSPGGGLMPSLYLYKTYIITTLAVFSFGMYALGRCIFENRITAVYLALATLFAGLSLESLHSDQSITILFWLPWIGSAAALFHRHHESARGAGYFCIAILLSCVQLQDQYPHFFLVMSVCAAVPYFFLYPRRCIAFLRNRWIWLLPALVPAALTVLDLWVVKEAVAEYRPSLRKDVIVNPDDFHWTGFIQPSGFLGSFLPLTNLGGHEAFAEYFQRKWGEGGVVYRLNTLVFNIGFLPLVGLAAFFFGPHSWRKKVGWGVPYVLVAAVGLQPTRVYEVLARLPVFNVFRSYFLYVLFLVFLSLVMSGFGFDALWKMGRGSRRKVTLPSLGTVLLLMLLSWWILRVVVRGKVPEGIRSAALEGLGVDLAIAFLGTAVSLGGLWIRDRLLLARLTVLVVVGSGCAYMVGVYREVGIPVGQLERLVYEYDPGQSDPANAEGLRDPAAYRRREAPSFPKAYLARVETASLRRDLEGTFFRSRSSAVFHEDLDPRVTRALTGIDHPICWVSRECRPVENVPALNRRMNEESARISDHLHEVVYVSDSDWSEVGKDWNRTNLTPGSARLRDLEIRSGYYSVQYQSDRPVFLNLSVNYESHWRARLDGRRVRLLRGNYNGMVVVLPEGSGKVEFEYQSTPGRFYVGSRYLLLASGLAALILLLIGTLRRSEWDPNSRA